MVLLYYYCLPKNAWAWLLNELIPIQDQEWVETGQENQVWSGDMSSLLVVVVHHKSASGVGIHSTLQFFLPPINGENYHILPRQSYQVEWTKKPFDLESADS